MRELLIMVIMEVPLLDPTGTVDPDQFMELPSKL
jgi:hypothetical protein